MNKIKKVLAGFGAFFIGLVSKVFAKDALMVESKYGVADPRLYETKYGIYEPTIGEKALSIGKIALPIILFVIGIFVILSKKLTKKLKAIIISILIILAILGYVLMSYISVNF